MMYVLLDDAPDAGVSVAFRDVVDDVWLVVACTLPPPKMEWATCPGVDGCAMIFGALPRRATSAWRESTM